MDAAAAPELLDGSPPPPGPAMADPPPPGGAPSDDGGSPWSVVMASARGVASAAAASVSARNRRGDGDADAGPGDVDPGDGPAPSSGNGAFLSSLTSGIASSVSGLNTNLGGLNAGGGAALGQSVSAMTASLSRTLSHGIAGRNTLPDRTTASQVLMFRQLLHTACRPGLRLSRRYEGTAAQRAVLHMPWWERGIEQSKKMVISYDNLVTRLWLSGAIMPFERGGYAADVDASGTNIGGATGAINTLINERGLPPVPHPYWVDRLGFQQDDPVTDFRSGGVLSLAMLVHVVESCTAIHRRFVPKPKPDAATMPATAAHGNPEDQIPSLEEIVADDASVLPFGITCINITDMLAKFLLFSKAIDKMDALLSSKPFWRMFIDPNAMLVLQEVSLDLLCDVCVEIGRERRTRRLADAAGGKEGGGEGVREVAPAGMPGSQNGKVTVFDFSEIMERTEKRVGDEVLGPGPQNVDELRAIARRVKSKYLMRIQLREKHSSPPANGKHPTSPLGRQIPSMPSKESVKNVTSSVIGGMGGFVSMLKKSPPSGAGGGGGSANDRKGDRGVEVRLDGTTSGPDDAADPSGPPGVKAVPFASRASPDATEGGAAPGEVDELEKLSAELGDLSAATAEAFDLLGDDFDRTNGVDGDVDHSEELLDAMDGKIDPFAAFAIDDDDFLS